MDRQVFRDDRSVRVGIVAVLAVAGRIVGSRRMDGG